MKLSFFSDKFDSEPQSAEVEFADLPGVLREVASADKETAPLWSPTLMEGGKTVGHTKSVEALSLDFDHIEPPWDKLAGWSYFAHTTHSHTAEDPHWRVVLELDEPADPATWKNRFKAKMVMHAMEQDPSCCNPNRSFFVPPPGAEWRENEGRPASMPVFDAAETAPAREDLDENADGLLSDGSEFWPVVERMMRAMPPSVAGDGGDDRLFEAACVLRSSFRLTPDAAFRALQVFNARCKPPWDEDRLWHKVSQAASDRQHPPGEAIPHAVKEKLRAASGVNLAPSPAPAAAPPTGLLWLPATAVVSLVTRVDYMCKALGIRDGRPSLWTADARCGKSTLAASVALACAGGTPLWGKLSIEQGPVCYVAGEDIEGVARTWKRLGLQQGIAMPDDLHISDQFHLTGPNYSHEKLVSLLSNHKLVVFDTLRSLSRDGSVEENDAKFAQGLYNLDAAGQGTGCSIIVLHHNNKQGKSNGTAALFGASGNHLELTRSEETCVTKGFAAGTRDGLSLPSFQVEANLNACPAPMDDPDSAGILLTYATISLSERMNTNASGIASRIVKRLVDGDRWMSRSELTADMGKVNDVQQALQVLRDNGKIGYRSEGKQHHYHWDSKRTPKA